MLLADIIGWWYGSGWIELARRLQQALRRLMLAFSVPILLRTLFAPWKRIISYSERSLGERARAALDNLISRLVGFGVRLLTLLAALVCAAGLIVGSVLLLVAWPLAPVAGLVLIVWGIL